MLDECVFFVVTSKTGGYKMCVERVKKENKKSLMKEIQEREEFIEFSNDDGEYMDVRGKK